MYKKEKNCMSDHQIGIQETEDVPLPPHPPHHSGNHDESENRFVRFCKRSLDQGDEVIYAIVGICFFLGAFFALGYSFWDFSVGITPVFSLSARPSDVAKTIIQLVSDLLL